MDNLWYTYVSKFDSILDIIPYHANIITTLETKLEYLSNILLYSYPGFPLEVLYDIALKRKFGSYKRNKLIWDKEVIYNETPAFFEIDLSLPQQPRDLVKITEFIKHIAINTGIATNVMQRHIIIIKNIDIIVNNNKFFDFRMLLERFSNNVFFICTTHYFGRIEMPIKSRFQCIRVPLLTVEQMEETFRRMELEFHPALEKQKERNIYLALYVYFINKNYPKVNIEDLCKYKSPILVDFLKETTKPTHEKVRDIINRISINDASISDITSDIIHFIPKDKNDIFLKEACYIDLLLANTEGYRKPLYIEYLLHYGISLMSKNRKK